MGTSMMQRMGQPKAKPSVSDDFANKTWLELVNFERAHGRSPNGVEVRGLLRRCGLEVSEPSADLPARYREPEPMSADERGKLYQTEVKKRMNEGQSNAAAIQSAFLFVYGDGKQ
jgi:hypothetical protein